MEVTYRTDGKLFNLNRLRAQTKISTTTVVELQYADDNVVQANTEEDLQTTLNAFKQAYESIGLVLNTDKTNILYQPAPNTNVQGYPTSTRQAAFLTLPLLL